MAIARLLFATCFFAIAVATPPCQDAAACQALVDFDILFGKHVDEEGLSLLQLQAATINVGDLQDPLDFDMNHGDQIEDEGLSLLQRQAQTVNAAPAERIKVAVHELSVPDHFELAVPPKAPIAAPPKALVAAPPKVLVAAPPKAPTGKGKAPVTLPPQGNGIVPVTVPLTAKPPPVYTTTKPSSVGMSADQFPPSGTPTPEPGLQGNFNPAGVPVYISETAVVPAPFNAPAPPQQSLIDWWRPGGKWLSQVISYTEDRGGMAINPEDAVPTPAPPPYWRGRFGTPKPPMVKPNTETKQQFAAQQKEDAQDWRDCTVAEWSAWSCCGCEHPPNYPSGNHQVRYREVTTPHSRFGAPCPPQSEVIECVPGGPLYSIGR